MVSIALKRPTEISHDRGLAGITRPLFHSRSEGFVRASSARSKSPIKNQRGKKLDVIGAVDILYLPPHLIGNLSFMSAFPPAFRFDNGMKYNLIADTIASKPPKVNIKLIFGCC